METVRLLIVSHKPAEFPAGNNIFPILAGKALSKNVTGISGDDEGENISEKNSSYCELTAMYWAWKNLSADIIGLFHYRRYLWLGKHSRCSGPLKFESYSRASFYLPDDNNIMKLLSRADMLLPGHTTYPWSLEVDYKLNHISEDFEIVTRIISEMIPDYLETWIRIMKFNNRIPHFNMFICRFPLFSKYCNWLFPLLSEVEKRILFSPYNYQKRVIGFIAERLFLLWCEKNSVSRLYFPVVFFNEKEHGNDSLFLVKKTLRSASFILGNPRAILPAVSARKFISKNFPENG